MDDIPIEIDDLPPLPTHKIPDDIQIKDLVLPDLAEPVVTDHSKKTFLSQSEAPHSNKEEFIPPPMRKASLDQASKLAVPPINFSNIQEQHGFGSKKSPNMKSQSMGGQPMRSPLKSPNMLAQATSAPLPPSIIHSAPLPPPISTPINLSVIPPINISSIPPPPPLHLPSSILLPFHLQYQLQSIYQSYLQSILAPFPRRPPFLHLAPLRALQVPSNLQSPFLHHSNHLNFKFMALTSNVLKYTVIIYLPIPIQVFLSFTFFLSLKSVFSHPFSPFGVFILLIDRDGMHSMRFSVETDSKASTENRNQFYLEKRSIRGAVALDKLTIKVNTLTSSSSHKWIKEFFFFLFLFPFFYFPPLFPLF